MSKVNSHNYFGFTIYSNVNQSNHIETLKTKLLIQYAFCTKHRTI